MTILHIDSSISGENSASRAISRSIVDQLRHWNPASAVVTRDLVSDPLPHLTLDAFADTSVLDEFLQADTVVIGAPITTVSAARNSSSTELSAKASSVRCGKGCDTRSRETSSAAGFTASNLSTIERDMARLALFSPLMLLSICRMVTIAS